MPNTGPRPRKPRKAEGAQIPYIIPQHEISFDAEAFDNLIKSQGIRLVHYRAIPDPRGMTSRGDTHDTLGIRDSSDGFIYREAGVVQVFFQNNPNSSGVNERGMLEVSSAYITLPRNYENTEEPIIADVFDRFFLKDIEIRVAAKQYVEASDTNVDRLQFPATCVEYIVDANGVYYTENIDFNINCDGYIEWISQHRPGFNPQDRSWHDLRHTVSIHPVFRRRPFGPRNPSRPDHQSSDIRQNAGTHALSSICYA
jgi:hypothetical protein